MTGAVPRFAKTVSCDCKLLHPVFGQRVRRRNGGRKRVLTRCHTLVNLYDMKVIQARIDAATEKALARLRRQTGMTDSQLVRKGLELVSQTAQPITTRRVRGVGRFASGRSDLGSNKSHLSGFGRS